MVVKCITKSLFHATYVTTNNLSQNDKFGSSCWIKSLNKGSQQIASRHDRTSRRRTTGCKAWDLHPGPSRGKPRGSQRFLNKWSIRTCVKKKNSRFNRCYFKIFMLFNFSTFQMDISHLESFRLSQTGFCSLKKLTGL